MNKKNAAALIVAGWAIPYGVLMLTIIANNDRIYYGIAFFYVSLCFVIIVAYYTCIIRIVRKKEIEMSDNQEQKHRISNDMRAAKVIATIIVCYVITIIPAGTYFCVVANKTFLPDGIPGLKETSLEIYYAVMLTLAMANSGINPLIYFLRNPIFKESLVKRWKRPCPLGCRSNRLSSEIAGRISVCNSEGLPEPVN